MYVCVLYVCMYVCLCVCLCVCMYVYKCTTLCMHMCKPLSMRTHVYMYIYRTHTVSIYVCLHTSPVPVMFLICGSILHCKLFPVNCTIVYYITLDWPGGNRPKSPWNSCIILPMPKQTVSCRSVPYCVKSVLCYARWCYNVCVPISVYKYIHNIHTYYLTLQNRISNV